MKKLLWIGIFCVAFSMNAQQTENDQIKETIATFFKGLHNGDTTIVKTTLHKDLKLQSMGIDKEGKHVLHTQPVDSFLKGLAGKNPEDKWFEKLLSYDIKIDGIMANVWTPYEFYRNDTFSHCGVNTFQLFNNNGHWEIIYLVDTRRRNDCNPSE